MARDRRTIDQKNQQNLAVLAPLVVAIGGLFVARGLDLPRPWWWMLVPLAVAAAILCWRWYASAIRRAKANGESEGLDKVRRRVYWAVWGILFVGGGLACVVGKVDKLPEQPAQTLPNPADEPVERANP